MAEPRDTAVAWIATGDAEWPYAAKVAGQNWLIRIGDFPAEPFYTLTIDGEAVVSFDTWPEAWTRPDARSVE
jgi:hypothetical protein